MKEKNIFHLNENTKIDLNLKILFLKDETKEAFVAKVKAKEAELKEAEREVKPFF
jgi:hypothetical protein